MMMMGCSVLLCQVTALLRRRHRERCDIPRRPLPCICRFQCCCFKFVGKAALVRHAGVSGGGSIPSFSGHLSMGESCGILCEELEAALLVLMNFKANLSARSRIGSQLKEKVRSLLYYAMLMSWDDMHVSVERSPPWTRWSCGR